MSVSSPAAAAAYALSVLMFAGKPLAPPAPDGPAAQKITVPASLKARSTTIEPSGIAWSKALDRYLVVSDDTGDSGNHHQPWVLAMTRAGAFDEAPLPIEGLTELNDAESITAGPDGLFFLSTSHSLNKREHESAARQMLLLLELAGRTLRVVGRVDLKTARAADGGGLLEIAGLPADGRLDIEAITFREGALLIGLKSPLTAKNNAVVLRLAAPVAALRAGKIAPGAVTRQWDLSLTVTDQRIPQGIADLATLPDGSLAIAANAPKGGAADGGGALYHFVPGAGTAPRLLRHFSGLRPEGVTVSADGKELLVVFDQNDDPPMWMTWPLPARGAK